MLLKAPSGLMQWACVIIIWTAISSVVSGATVTSMGVQLSASSSAGTPATVTLSLLYESTIYQCSINPSSAGQAYSCVPTAIGRDCSFTETKMLIENAHSDAVLLANVFFETDAGDTYTVASFCISDSAAIGSGQAGRATATTCTVQGEAGHVFNMIALDNQMTENAPSKQVFYFDTASPNVPIDAAAWQDGTNVFAAANGASCLNDLPFGTCLAAERVVSLWYDGSSFDALTQTWTDLTGNGYDAQVTSGTLNVFDGVDSSNALYLNGNRAVYGDTSTKVAFGSLYVNAQNTVFNLCKYHGSNKARILTASADNALFGFWQGKSGLVYNGGWITTSTIDQFGDDWVLSSQTPALYRGNTQDLTVTPQSGVSIGVLKINDWTNEESDFACAEVIVFNDQLLAIDEIECIENYLISKYGLAFTRNPTAATMPPTTFAPTAVTGTPTRMPTLQPTMPTLMPSLSPTLEPTMTTATPSSPPTVSSTTPTATPSSLPTSAPTLYCATHSGSISSYETDWKLLSLSVASDLVIDSCDSNYDTWLYFRSAITRSTIDDCDDCGDCGSRTVLNVSNVPAGEYEIGIGGFSSRSGSYNVIVACNARPTPRPIAHSTVFPSAQPSRSPLPGGQTYEPTTGLPSASPTQATASPTLSPTYVLLPVHFRGGCDDELTLEVATDGSNYVDVTSSLDGDANDWTEMKSGLLYGLSSKAKLRLSCLDLDGGGGLIASIEYDGVYYSTNGAAQNNGYYTLESATAGLTSTVTPQDINGLEELTDAPYLAQWTWTCGDDGDWSACPQPHTEVYVFDFQSLNLVPLQNCISRRSFLSVWILMCVLF